MMQGRTRLSDTLDSAPLDGERAGAPVAQRPGPSAADAQSDALRQAGGLDGADARARVDTLLSEGARTADIVAALHACSAGQRAEMAADQAFVERLVGASPPAGLSAVLAALGAARVAPAPVLARLAQSSEALRAGTRGEPSAWTLALLGAPRGAELDADSRHRLDEIALTLTAALTDAQLAQAFEVRFGHAPGAGDRHWLRSVWARLALRPIGQIDAHVIGRAGRLADQVGPEQAVAPPAGEDEGKDRQAAERAEPQKDADERDPAKDVSAALDAFIEACGGDAELRAAAEAQLAGASDGEWAAAVAAARDRGVLAIAADEVVRALPALLGRLGGPGHRPGESQRALPAWVGRQGFGRLTGDR